MPIMPEVKRGEIYYVDLGDGIGSEVKKIRPCIVIQNDIGNMFSSTTIICLSHTEQRTPNNRHKLYLIGIW